MNKRASVSIETRKKMGLAHSGKNNHFYGKKHTAESIEKIKLARAKQIEPHSGFHNSDEVKERMSLVHKNAFISGRITWSKNKKFSKEKYPKWGWRTSRAKQIFPQKDTTIEVKLQEYLKQLGIEFYTHQYIPIKYAYQCDIFIPVQNGIKQKTIIECDGDYWHGNTKLFDFRKLNRRMKCQIPLDFERTAQLEEKGYRIIRLWGSEIKQLQLNDFKTKII